MEPMAQASSSSPSALNADLQPEGIEIRGGDGGAAEARNTGRIAAGGGHMQSRDPPGKGETSEALLGFLAHVDERVPEPQRFVPAAA